MHAVGIIGTIIFGAIIGLLARLILPGRQSYGMIVTVLIGIVGALIGYFVVGTQNTGGIDWIRWIVSILAALVLSFIYAAVTRRSGTRA